MKILKFGGTSVGAPERMKQVAQLVAQTPGPRLVVLSALAGTTNALVEIAEACLRRQNPQEKIEALAQHYQSFVAQLYSHAEGLKKGQQIIEEHFQTLRVLVESEDFGPRDEKMVLAQGELMSTKFFQAYLEETGQESALLAALHFMKIDEEGEPLLEYIAAKLSEELTEYPGKILFVTQGYICLNHLGEIDNLKRGGSDYSATLIGAAIRAEEVQIWTDIDGMHNADPRFVENTFPVAELSFEEASELAYFGAKILHPSAIHPAQLFNIPVRLLNTLMPDTPGTLIYAQPTPTPGIKSIAAKDGLTAIKIKSTRMLMAYGFLRKIFEVFESYKTPIDMITTSEVAVSLTIDDETHLEAICQELERYGKVETDTCQSIICIVGNFVSEQKGTPARIFKALENIPIRMISFGGSRHNISILVSTQDKIAALNQLHQGLFGEA
ncbi:MAG: aspartate kinase [Microscillaceae bacterium]|nr:aspartate kinase [Microscillaceae bacterium]